MKRLIPSALGSLRKYDAWACQGSVFKWATVVRRPPLQASGQLLGIVWALSYGGGCWCLLRRLRMEREGRGRCVLVVWGL